MGLAWGKWRLPLEPIVCFVGKEKMTMDTSEVISFWAHQQLAREALVDGKVLLERQFDVITRGLVSDALHSVP